MGLRGPVPLEDAVVCRIGIVLVVEDVFDANHPAGEFASGVLGDFLVYLGGLRQSGLGINFDEGVEMRLRLYVV